MLSVDLMAEPNELNIRRIGTQFTIRQIAKPDHTRNEAHNRNACGQFELCAYWGRQQSVPLVAAGMRFISTQIIVSNDLLSLQDGTHTDVREQVGGP